MGIGEPGSSSRKCVAVTSTLYDVPTRPHILAALFCFTVTAYVSGQKRGYAEVSVPTCVCVRCIICVMADIILSYYYLIIGQMRIDNKTLINDPSLDNANKGPG